MRWVAIAALLCVPGCLEDDRRAIMYFNFEQLEPAAAGSHYQQFAEINGAVADLGCFVVERRQVLCSEFLQNGDPKLRPAVVECDRCPCTDVMEDPCRPAADFVTKGEIRGTVDHPDGVLRAGGVEYPTQVALDTATELFITIEPDDLDAPGPSGDIILRGDLVRDGSVLRGLLVNPQGALVKGRVTIVPLEDEVTL
jgi:hypothetical protein